MMKIINDKKNPNEEIHWDFFMMELFSELLYSKDSYTLKDRISLVYID